MIYNKNIDRLAKTEVVKDFMRRNDFKMATQCKDYSFVLHKIPYVIEFKDALIENYLEIYFSDLNSDLYIVGNCALACGLDIGNQDLLKLKKRDLGLKNHPDKEIFLSENEKKIGNLYDTLEAIDGLIPLFDTKGGLASMRNGTFDSRFDFKTRVDLMWHGMKERYLRCIGEGDFQP
ncbi:hypothetical protein [Amphibiibacter pelophylacis]|uniref:Uncharacterized protein n=1 Tax=Amphibiibacter pelophylacis TaxID=1799477 RepID=A0ACC6P5R7_9BURK